MTEAIFEILHESLKLGQTVEIEGLGTFRVTGNGRYRFVPQTQPQVFVAYVVEDLEPARRLCEALRAEGCSPWLDKEKLMPGQNWPRAIERAIEISDVFVACFSRRSISKRGQFQSELRYALHCARLLPLDATFFIPVRLERCTLPLHISSSVQYVDLYPDWDRGLKRVAQAIHRAVRARPRARGKLVSG